MTRAVRFLARAKDDLARLDDFLAEKNPDAANRAATTISEAVMSLADNSERGRPGRGDVRELVVSFGRDGYVVQYRVAPRDVFIARIFHAREQR